MTITETSGSSPTRAPSRRDVAVLAWLKLALAAAWLAVIVFVLLASTTNAFRVSSATRSNVTATSPEGWAFFTRNPREPVTLVYVRAGGSFELLRLDQLSRANPLAFRRDARLLGEIASELVAQVPEGRWVASRSSLPEALGSIELPPSAVVKRTRALPELCGEAILQVVEPVPWAWSAAERPVQMPSKTARLEVRCS